MTHQLTYRHAQLTDRGSHHDRSARQKTEAACPVWFGLGGLAAGFLAWAIMPGLVARELAPTSWQWPERMAARTLDMPRWEAGQRMMQSASPTGFRAIVAADRIMIANRETIEGCRKAAAKAREPVRCTIRVGELTAAS